MVVCLNSWGMRVLTRLQCEILAKAPEQYHTENLRMAMIVLRDDSAVVLRLLNVIRGRRAKLCAKLCTGAGKRKLDA
jgi:hypothetical protein